jgi:hypothetical protein
MKAPISKPVNDTQTHFNKLCEMGGGVKGGPARGKVLALLKESGQALNGLAHREMADHLAANSGVNPWFVCFAVGLSWGHLAQLEIEFTDAVCNFLTNDSATDFSKALKFHMERGEDPIRYSLLGAKELFAKVKLPEKLPAALNQLGDAQQRWLSPILHPISRPRYIGAWNATAMFMSALFAQPALAATQFGPPPMLPPGGPIQQGLSLLHRAGILSRPPAGSDLDDAAFEPGAIYENNGLFEELCRQQSNWGLIDVHSGVYMLGTRHPLSGKWV